MKVTIIIADDGEDKTTTRWMLAGGSGSLPLQWAVGAVQLSAGELENIIIARATQLAGDKINIITTEQALPFIEAVKCSDILTPGIISEPKQGGIP